MGVAVKTSLGVSVVATLFSCQVPYDEGLVSAAGKKHVGAFMLSAICSCTFTATVAHFSMDVARLVTQPLWPVSSPRMINCSAMIANEGGLNKET